MIWISVKDKLPDNTEWVLVYADGAINCMAYVKNRGTFEDWTYPENPNVVPELITHWARIETLTVGGKA